MPDPVIYTMAIIKDGEIIATKAVRTYLEGATKAATPAPAGELVAIEFAWMIRAKELARDILHFEGRFDEMRRASKAANPGPTNDR